MDIFKFSSFSVLIVVCLMQIIGCSQSSSSIKTGKAIPLPTKERQDSLSPEQIILKLNRGNERSVSGELRNYNQLTRRQLTSVEGQYPVAVILSCIDSRSIPEKIFDLNKGDLFAVRVAGNVVNDDVLGSLEYSTAVAGAKVIIVLGHTSCGAVKASCEPGEKPGHIEQLVAKIRPSVMSSSKLSDGELLTSIENNARATTKQILKESKIISDLVADGKLILKTAVHNISNGKVNYLD